MAAVLIPLLTVSSVVPLGLPTSSSLGCAPINLLSEGPYRSSLKGFVDFDKKAVGIRHGVKNVYVAEPGTSASMTFGYLNPDIFHEWNVNWTIKPYLGLFDANPDDAPWLSVSYSPNPVIITPKDEKVNVTAALSIAKDAPLGEYGLLFGGKIPSEDCIYGPRDFILRVGREKPSHAFTLSYLSSISDGRAVVRQFYEGERLAALLVAIERNSSVKLNLRLSSEYPYTLFFNMWLVNISSRSRGTTVEGLETKINVTGITWDQGRYPIGQHKAGNISLTLAAKGGVKEGAYSALFTVDAYPTPVWFEDPKIETSEIPVFIWIAKNATAIVTEAVPYTFTSTLTATSTTTVIIRSTATETSTRTVPTTATSTLTSIVTSTFIETVTEPLTYAWVAGAVATAVILITVLVLRKRR